VRAEHTARMLDGLFHADLQGARTTRQVTLSGSALLAIMGAERRRAARPRGDVCRSSRRGREPVSIVSSTTAARRARGRCADTISAEMWESVNTFDLQLPPRPGRRPAHRAVLDLQLVKERSARCSGA
jgi:uncharacterized alpha-E superfamily protein